jgi:protein crumbs
LCPRGYKGKLCQDIQFCEIQKCPGNAVCKNLDDGYDCITNMTFQGNEHSPLIYHFMPRYNDENQIQNNDIDSTIEISYRTKTGGTLLYVDDVDMYFEVSVYKDQVTISWRLSSDLPETHRFHRDNKDFNWSTIYIRIANHNHKMEAGFKGWEVAVPDPNPIISTSIDQSAYSHLFSGKFPIYLGERLETNNAIPKGKLGVHF